jgi:hypothetical protein
MLYSFYHEKGGNTLDYKVKDRVVITKNFEEARKGFAGKIVCIDEDGFYGIEFDAYMDGHSCDRNARDGFGYYVDGEYFELEEQPTVHTVEIYQNSGEDNVYAYITCKKIHRDKDNYKIIYVDGIKIEFDEICTVIN